MGFMGLLWFIMMGLMGWLMMSKNPVKMMWKSRIATNFAEFDS